MNKHLVWIVLFVAVAVLMSFLKDQRKKKQSIIFFGDSITEAGVQPEGYINLLRSKFEKEFPQIYTLTGAGIGGNKIYDLYLRLDEDILQQAPQWVVIYIGINDVWHKQLFGTGTDLDKFQQFYQAIISKLKAAGIQPILCTPSLIGEMQKGTNCCDEDLQSFSAAIKALSLKNDCPLADMQESFRNYELKNNMDHKASGLLTTDGVHLTPSGNELAAETLWPILLQTCTKK